MQFRRSVFVAQETRDSLLADKSSQFPPTASETPASVRHQRGSARVFREFLRIVEERERVVRFKQRAELELGWLREHSAEYAGRWVALIGNELIAVADSARDAYRIAGVREEPVLVTRVEIGEIPFAGW